MNGTDVYLATCAELPSGDPDTERLSAHLRASGLSVDVAVWDDPTVPWSSAPCTVIRSTWDYHLRREDFVRWAHSLPHLHNPASLVEWNTDKTYLLDLPSDVEVVPTRVLRAPTAQTVEDSLADLGWAEGVLKPAVGLDGHGVSRVRRGTVRDLPREGVWLLQAFVSEAGVDGETSVMLIDGRPTHAVRRLPPPHDFRAQERLGGTVELCEPPDDTMRLAQRLIEAVDPSPLYARVDIVRRGGRPVVMELELVEPSLFFEHCPAALDSMSDAIRTRIEAGSTDP